MTIVMNRWGKLGIVLAGYAVAAIVSGVAVGIYDRRFTPADNQAMGGMIAGGEMIYGAGVFALVALLPTGLALWFLRRSRRSWSVFSLSCLAFAVIGLASVLTPLVVRPTVASQVPALEIIFLVSLVQMLGSPLWVASFGVFALLAPARDLRWRLLAAAAIEVVIGGCGLLHFLSPGPRI